MNKQLSGAMMPPVWLVVLIAGLPLLTETVYTPSLPDIARELSVSDSWAEYTLSIYLLGFAVGVFIWGKLSDLYGRKPFILIGMAIYLMGCAGCYFSDTITMLMVSRFVQAIGGSVGSILSQAIVRDAFQGPALGRVYASVGASLSVFPAIGPIIGGFIAQAYHWSYVFLFLLAAGTFLWGATFLRLPETHHPENRKNVSLWSVAKRLGNDPAVIAYGLLIGLSNGMYFSFFAEGPFYLMDLLGMSPSAYGFVFLGSSASYLIGNLCSKKLQAHKTPHEIMRYGLFIIVATCLLSLGVVCLSESRILLLWATVVNSTVLGLGMALVNSNALALALQNYRDVTGTASSLFGFFYYNVVSLTTMGMGYLHDGTLFAMPLYFLGVAILMLASFTTLLKESLLTKKALA